MDANPYKAPQAEERVPQGGRRGILRGIGEMLGLVVLMLGLVVLAVALLFLAIQLSVVWWDG